MNPRSLKSIIADQIEAKDTTVDKVIEKTGIPDNYMRAIMSGQIDRLPALPYIRAHLLAIADYLELDKNVLFQVYRTEFSHKMSGEADRLPGNRFARTRRNFRWIWVGVFILIGGLITYSVLRSAFFGTPYFRLVNPPHDIEIFETVGPTIMLAGTTEASGKLSINNEPVTVRPDGSFEFELPLVPEINTVIFKVERFLGKTLVIERRIDVQPLFLDPLSTSSAPVNAPAKTSASSSTDDL